MLKDFRAYNQARQLYKECQQIKAHYNLKDQLSRATLSIVLNLAEGAAKPTKNDQKKFYAIAYGSLRETQALLDLIEDKAAIEAADKVGAQLYRLVYPKH